MLSKQIAKVINAQKAKQVTYQSATQSRLHGSGHKTKHTNKHTAFNSVMITLFLSGAVLSPTVNAQTEGFEFGVDAKTVFDDNIFREQEKESDTIFQISPVAAYKGLYGKHQITAGYEGDYAFYADNSDINYQNHRAKAQLDLSLTAKWSAKLGLQYVDQVEEPGTNNRELNDAVDFTKFDSLRANIETAYGTRQSIGQLVLKYGKQDYNYSNNFQEFRDRTQDDITGTFFWRVAPKSRMIFEVRTADVKSDNVVGFNQSFDQVSYLTGVTWEATAKTEGSLRVGYQDTQFDNPLIADLDGLSYFVDVDYKPDTDSIINITLSRTARDNAELVLAGLETTDFSVSWKTPFARKLSFELEYRYRQDEFGGGSNARKDDTNRVKSELGYRALDWLVVYAGVDYMSRDSDNAIYEFDNNRVSLGVEIAFD